ncbi:MAG: BON domain-containing protein [Gemmataceae bacterium]|nr:BON domain-containing protein [Gemmataceae bacterium]
MVVRRLALASALGLGMLAGSAISGEPSRLPVLPSANQELADSLAARLKASGLLKEYRVEVAVTSGTVELTGTVADQSQREEVVRLVQGVPSVVRVIDKLAVAGAPIRRVRQPDLPKAEAPKVELPPPLPGTGTPPPSSAEKGEKADRMPEPVPHFRAVMPAYAALTPPQMPPYAWPTYAPYNNFSRVATPTAYPYHSWPYIGPVYPFPKVPPGWRSVKLEWDDGHWWFSRVAHPHDWWKLRFW